MIKSGIKEICPIGFFFSPLKTKFGIPRQSGVVKDLEGEIRLTGKYNNPEMVRGLDDCEYLWLIWGFSANDERWKNTVRPPRMGGNVRVGVLATRSPFRPNALGLSCVKLSKLETDDGNIVIKVTGADLMDGTPVYDIKPYISYSDSHSGAKYGPVDDNEWKTLSVVIPENLKSSVGEKDCKVISELLKQNPVPAYHNDRTRMYGMKYKNMDVKFRIDEDVLFVTEIINL